MAPKGRRPFTAVKIIGIILIGVGLDVLLNHLPIKFQHHYGDLFKAAIVLLVGGTLSYLVEHWLGRINASNRIGSRRVTSLRFMARLVLYLTFASALLAAFGVGLSSVIFGSAFVTVIVGLAGQSFFANLIAGIGIVIFHPFEVGDRVMIVAWQYPLLMPTYPHEAIKPGYSGIVTDINLAYTTLETDEGIPMMLPNGIIIQAAIHNQQRRERQRFRFRFDLDIAIDPGHLMPKLEGVLKDLPYPTELRLVDVGVATFSIIITGETTGRREDVIKNEILEHLIPMVQASKLPSSSSTN